MEAATVSVWRVVQPCDPDGVVAQRLVCQLSQQSRQVTGVVEGVAMTHWVQFCIRIPHGPIHPCQKPARIQHW